MIQDGSGGPGLQGRLGREPAGVGARFDRIEMLGEDGDPDLVPDPRQVRGGGRDDDGRAGPVRDLCARLCQGQPTRAEGLRVRLEVHEDDGGSHCLCGRTRSSI